MELNNPLPRWWLNMFYITLAFSLVYLILYPGERSCSFVRGLGPSLETVATFGKGQQRIEVLRWGG